MENLKIQHGTYVIITIRWWPVDAGRHKKLCSPSAKSYDYVAAEEKHIPGGGTNLRRGLGRHRVAPLGPTTLGNQLKSRENGIFNRRTFSIFPLSVHRALPHLQLLARVFRLPTRFCVELKRCLRMIVCAICLSPGKNSSNATTFFSWHLGYHLPYQGQLFWNCGFDLWIPYNYLVG
jgi:hypothetical protein